MRVASAFAGLSMSVIFERGDIHFALKSRQSGQPRGSPCRKGSGSAHGANLFSSKASIAWLSGREDVATFRVPGTRHERSFCTACGSALPGVQAEGGLLVVPAGSIDSAIAIRPMAHICCASRASWDEQLEQVPRLDALPG
jgi:hypothetical protein